MMEPVRPALKEPVIAYLASYAAILAAASLITLPVPSPVRIPLVLLVGIVTAVPVGLGIWKAVYSHFTEQYLVDGGEVTIRRGFITKTGADISIHNVSGVVVVKPFPFRLLGVGTVEIRTNDGGVHLLYNLKDAPALTEKIRPSLAG